MNSPTWHLAPLFASLRAPQRARLEGMVHLRRLDAGEMLFLEEDSCTGFFVLVEGAIQLTRSGVVPGAHPTLALILPVNSFAEAAMFGEEAFPVTATAIKPSRVAHFPKAAFLAALREDSDLALAVIHAQAVWLRKLTQKVQELSGSDSQERLRTWLRAHLSKESWFMLPVTKKALAAQLGMTPETLSRGLRTFQDQGVLEVEGTRLRWKGPI